MSSGSVICRTLFNIRRSPMNTLSKVQLAAAIVAALGFAAGGSANADPVKGSQFGVSEKNSPSRIQIAEEKKEETGKAAGEETKEKGAEKSCKGKEKSCKGKEKSCKGKEKSCKGKEKSCKGKEGSCKGKEGSCKGAESSN